jgi:hypothetical protein
MEFVFHVVLVWISCLGQSKNRRSGGEELKEQRKVRK